jgi:hypothetical protein
VWLANATDKLRELREVVRLTDARHDGWTLLRI